MDKDAMAVIKEKVQVFVQELGVSIVILSAFWTPSDSEGCFWRCLRQNNFKWEEKKSDGLALTFKFPEVLGNEST